MADRLSFPHEVEVGCEPAAGWEREEWGEGRGVVVVVEVLSARGPDSGTAPSRN